MTQIKVDQSDKKKRVSKLDWLNAALRLLQAGGIEAVRIEPLAETLGVAKSGFYYHFKDRADLRAKLLQHWLELDGTPLIEEQKFRDASPADRIEIVADAVDRADLSRYDFAIRQWARTDPKVRRTWRKEMNKRLEHVRRLFRDLGFEGDELEARVRMFVAYQVSERELFSDLTSADRARLRCLRITLLVGEEPKTSERKEIN